MWMGKPEDIILCFAISELATSSRGASSYLSDHLSLISLLHVSSGQRHLFSLPPLPDAGYMTLCSVSSSILATIGGEGKDRNWGFLFLRFIFPVIHPLPHTTQNTIVSHYYQHTHTHTHTHTQWPKTTQRKKGRENKTLIFVLLYTFVWAGYYDT
ncbi:hypothetical protein CH63R_00720 [Colletotrichum higginsianum IMI 349063]|uniref:Uncharacterized protein n=1 Tax=Colletotrichum higginsianum (strain IMI 349063) TaxID=759273 RepID=A0A1B7YU14_COLHI|nr:hypothetical protein CH63R_00720 [Colletotrichum higginsianum IMI 349063]OBR15540.1 hypothetical protein CH63R_00720 [Colletotrichum higginsianum IMI 349063]